jgi:hypothetical protein
VTKAARRNRGRRYRSGGGRGLVKIVALIVGGPAEKCVGRKPEFFVRGVLGEVV